MEKFTKTTVGFVCQTYEKNAGGKFICTGQEFIAGDQVDYEDDQGNAVTEPEHQYQPFNMSLLSRAELAAEIEEALLSIDVGGEQSRQFATEIGMLKKVFNSLGHSINSPKKTKLGFLEAQLLEACKVITSYTTDLLYRLDDQVNLGDVEEIQQAKDAIAKYTNIVKN